jgi:NAD(P)-dependent dehydrogenase (short-subunit alcohol dehydrogenase family)
MTRYEGRIAVVTGAAQGIGARTALRLAAGGARIAAWDVQEEGAAATAEEARAAGGTAVGIGCDVAEPSSVAAALARTSQLLGSPSLVVTAAGVILIAPFLELRPEDFNRQLAVNLTGTFLTVQGAAREMVARGGGGRIVCISSVAGRGPRADSAAYAASKAGVISVVRSAAVALAPHSITVNAVCPGVVETDMTRRIAAQRAEQEGISEQEALDRLARRIPLGRLQRTDDVADVVEYFLSDAAGYVTGQALNACGGLEFD